VVADACGGCLGGVVCAQEEEHKKILEEEEAERLADMERGAKVTATV